MRRNLTISFDEQFIDKMDAVREKKSRGKWLEDIVIPAEALPALPTRQERARREAEDKSSNPPISDAVRHGTPGQYKRSPEPDAQFLDELAELQVPKENEREATQSPPTAQGAAKPPLQRPIIQKRGQ